MKIGERFYLEVQHTFAPAREWQWDIKAFRDRFRDITGDHLQPAPFFTLDGTIDVFSNVLNATLTGIEARLKYRPTPRTWIVLTHALMNDNFDFTFKSELHRRAFFTFRLETP